MMKIMAEDLDIVYLLGQKGKRENGMGIGLQAWYLVGQKCDNNSITASEQASDNHMMPKICPKSQCHTN